MAPQLLDVAVRERLREAGLRCTPARVDVFRVLQQAQAPLTHRDACDLLPDMDRITVFRNLVALVDAQIALRVELGDRVWRFAIAEVGHRAEAHVHPHFTCTSCGDVQCLDGVRVEGPDAALSRLMQGAEVQIRGVCGDCR